MYYCAISGTRSNALFLTFFASLALNLGFQTEGRKCVCTSKACKEVGVDTCTTRFSCYTEIIVAADQELDKHIATKGCTESPTPLLCETKTWPRKAKSSILERSVNSWIHIPWPRLKCCDTYDYCNANETYANVSTSILASKEIDKVESSVHDRGKLVAKDDQQLTFVKKTILHRLTPLYIAVFISAIAAVISVLAACYVITKFVC